MQGSDLVERLRYIGSILDANKNKFAVPDHIAAKAETCREAAARSTFNDADNRREEG